MSEFAAILSALSSDPEVRQSMERQVIRIVIAVCPAQSVVIRGSCNSHDIVTIELPVDILESVFLRIIMMGNNRPHLPFAQVGRADQGQRIASGSRAKPWIRPRNEVAQRPVVL